MQPPSPQDPCQPPGNLLFVSCFSLSRYIASQGLSLKGHKSTMIICTLLCRGVFGSADLYFFSSILLVNSYSASAISVIALSLTTYSNACTPVMHFKHGLSPKVIDLQFSFLSNPGQSLYSGNCAHIVLSALPSSYGMSRRA